MNKKDKEAQERYRLLLRQIMDSTAINPLESKKEQTDRIARAKTDYNYFVNTYFARYATAPCAPFHIDIANKIRANKRCKYLLGWGRGLAKSTHLNILIPLWLWINDDIKVMLLIGQNQDKAHILLSDIQAEFEGNQLLIHDYGAQRTIGSWEEGSFVTKNDCAFFALGMGQSVRGLRHRQHRPDYCVGDDLDTREVCKNPKRIKEYANWICEDVLGCLSPVSSRFILVNNVFSPTTILLRIKETKKGFVYNQQDAINKKGEINWHQNKSLRDFYDSQIEAMGTLSFDAEYNNKPYTEGTIFKESMILWKPLPHTFDSILGFWDIAYSDSETADFNAMKIWGAKDGQFYLIKAFVRQCKMEVAVRWANNYMLSRKRDVAMNWIFESQFWNDAVKMVIEEVSKDYDKPIVFIKSEKPEGAKYDRMINMLPYYQQGNIFYNIEERRCQDMQTGIVQLFGIEPGYKTKDDSPDADSSAIKLLSRRTRKAKHNYKVGKRENQKF